MSLNNERKTPTASDVFDDDFEVIYEGDLPDISIDDDDDDDSDSDSNISWSGKHFPFEADSNTFKEKKIDVKPG